MHLSKKILFTLLSTFLGYRIWVVSNEILEIPPAATPGIEIILNAFLLSLYATGVFAFMGFAFPTYRLCPSGYYQIRNAKRLSGIYQRWGVRYMKRFLLLVYWGRGRNRKHYFDGSRSGFNNLIRQSKQAEFSHGVAWCAIIVLSLFWITKEYYTMSFGMLLFNHFGNLYPVLLQRHHRMRVNRIMVGTKSR